MRFHRPSPSLVISCIALFVALGGVGYAAATGSIDGREIKNNAVATKDLKNNDVRGRDIRRSTIAGSDVALDTLTGLDVRESSLGKVPSAERADSAATAGIAGNANTVGGQRVVPFRYRSDSTAEQTTVATVEGLRLAATCVGGNTDVNLFNLSGATAEVTVALVGIANNQTQGTELVLANNDFTNLGLGSGFTVRNGQAGFHTQTGRLVRIIYTMNENVFGFDCSSSGVVIG